MDPFWAIVLSYLALKSMWKDKKKGKQIKKGVRDRYEQDEIVNRLARVDNEFRREEQRKKERKIEQQEIERLEKEVEKRKKKDIEDLRKQGFTDELIAVILPTINNGQ